MEGSKKQIVGHDFQWRFLVSLRRLGILPKAFLFWGPEGVGKKTLAKAWIRSFYQEKTSLLTSGIHPDVLLLEKGEEEILLEDVKRIQEFVGKRPVYGERKFVLIDNAHNLNEVASNSFLKTLEEPGESTHFILVSHRPNRLLPTIRSRCLEVRFFPLREEEVRDVLKEDDDKIYEGRLSPLIDLPRRSLREKFSVFCSQIKGRPVLRKDRSEFLLALRMIGIYLHDALANTFAPEVSYKVLDARIKNLEEWIKAGERLFEVSGRIDVCNLAVIEAELSTRVRLAL